MQIRHCERLAGVVAWIVLCHSRVGGNPVKPIKTCFFIGLFYHTM
ncbi:MAG: hypothetical protein AB8U82_06705 [Rickettsia endosymbiont of Haemaphysalis japonica]